MTQALAHLESQGTGNGSSTVGRFSSVVGHEWSLKKQFWWVKKYSLPMLDGLTSALSIPLQPNSHNTIPYPQQQPSPPSQTMRNTRTADGQTHRLWGRWAVQSHYSARGMSYLINEPVEKGGYEHKWVGHMVGSSLTFFWGPLLMYFLSLHTALASFTDTPLGRSSVGS